MKKQSDKNTSGVNMVKNQFSYTKKPTPKKRKYVYTEKDLGEGLLYMGLSAPAYFAQRY